MKAVILAAGKGTRMGDLAKEVPKALLSPRNGRGAGAASKTLLEYKIEALPTEVDEVILIIGHLGDKIRAHFAARGHMHAGKRIRYVEQREALGSAHALWQARPLLEASSGGDSRFIVMCGDDLYLASDIRACLKHPLAALIYEDKAAGSGGRVMLAPDGSIEAIVEGKHEGPHAIATGLYVLTPEIFAHEMVKIPGREEYGLPQTLIGRGFGSRLKAVYAKRWLQMNTPEHLAASAEELAPFIGGR